MLAAAAAFADEPWCRKTSTPDVVRVNLSVDCGSPDRIEVRRNGNDKARLVGVRQDAGWWRLDPFSESIDSVTLCSKVCGYASVCVAGVPKGERDAAGNRVCVADYTFDCDEAGWTLAIQAKPSATLTYTRKRAAVEQRGEVKAVSLKATRMCDLSVDETVEIVPKTTNYVFAPIPVSHDALQAKQNSVWILGRDALMDYVRLPQGRRSHPLTEQERTFFQVDIKELTLMIAGEVQP
jgi:hypothetical protein